MAELSRRSGVSVATIKFYLREGLLPPGRATGATRAHYDDTHVTRLRLIRALADVAGLTLQQTRSVLTLLETPQISRERMLGAAHLELSAPGPEPGESARDRVARLVNERGWLSPEDGPHALALARALEAMDSADQPLNDDVLTVYADAAERIADADLLSMRPLEGEESVAFAIIGTVLTEPVLIALRRMAQEHRARADESPKPHEAS